LIIRGGRVLDPGSDLDGQLNVVIENGRIQVLGENVAAPHAQILNAEGLIVAPGFVDLHAHLRDPGQEYKETIPSGTEAAARGGFTTICCMPNTDPPIDTRATVEYVLRTASSAKARVLPIGCVTKGRAGQDLAELADLAEAGCVAFSDDGSPVRDAAVLRHALEYAQLSGRAVIDHCEDVALSRDGVMHEGWVSTRLGLAGQPAMAEEALVARDIAVAAEVGAPIHIAHISTAGAIDHVRRAKRRGVPVTAEVTPHHLSLTHEAIAGPPNGSETSLRYDTNAKVNPPLRTVEDVAACIEGLGDGTIDAVATDHAPHADYEKAVEFDVAPFGISGLETAFGLCMKLVHDGALDLRTLIERLTKGPVRALGLERFVSGIGTMRTDAPADVVLLDPNAEWTVEPERFASKGRNTPLAGWTLKGKIVATISRGTVVWAEERVVA
jgi:dihydroorotase